MPQYIESSPLLFRRLQALPPPAQRRLWQALDHANGRFEQLLRHQEATAAQWQRQDYLLDHLLPQAAHLWDAHAPQLTNPERRLHLAAARRQVAALAVQDLRMPVARIARRLRRDRVTIHRSLGRHHTDLATDADYARRFRQLRQALAQLAAQPEVPTLNPASHARPA